MASCPTCPNCDTQMVVAKVYGASVCKCPNCMSQVPIQKSREESYKEYVSKNKK